MSDSTERPSREREVERWRALAREIAATVPELSETPWGDPVPHPGQLVVLGSGIHAVGFTREAEQYIRAADVVLYCVADPATEVWLRQLRPDAYDLYVLYNDGKRRYFTYMQMSETMLYHVRRGRKVAVVYYGHPGIFVLSTHRAIAIARREGHHARMLPGISALDCLCADLGIDPSYPGLQTFEATDMLLRRRPIDTAAHVVLWQVGLVGELGFRRRGFINRHFNLLVDYLEGAYGREFEVTHYIAARYPTLPPVIERYRLRDLCDPTTRTRFTGISTFYLPPKTARPIDRGFAEAVDLLTKDDRTGPPRPFRAIDRYGPVELRALRELAQFDVPPDYRFQRETPAARFLIALTEDEQLRERYVERPKEAVADARFSDLSARDRRLLASRQPARVQAAARGADVSWSPGEQFVIDLMTKISLVKAYNAILVQFALQKDGYQSVDAWLAQQGYAGFSSLDYGTYLANVQAALLLAWTGVYVAEEGVSALVVIGNPQSNSSSVVLLNGVRILKPAFSNGTLSWNASDGNPNSAVISFSPPAESATVFLRQAAGKIWTGAAPPSTNNFSATEALPPDNPLGVWIGEYQTQLAGGGAGPTITVMPPDANHTSPFFTVDGQAITDYTFAGNELSWGNSQVTFAVSSTPGSLTLTGQLDGYGQVSATSTAEYSTGYQGEYVTQWLSDTNQWNPYLPTFFSGGTLVIGHQTISNVSFSNNVLTWSGAGGAANSGSLQFMVNPLNNQPMFQGFIWAASSSKPAAYNFQGTLSTQFLQSWSGSYTSSLNNQPGPTLFIQGQAPPVPTNVFYNGAQVNYTFMGDQLTGQVDQNISFAAVFSYAVQNSVVIRSFRGSVTTNGTSQSWQSLGQSNDLTLWQGTYTTTITLPGGQTQPGPTVLIVALSPTDFTVSLVAGDTSAPITGAVYTSQYNLLSWVDNTGTPSNQFPNAALTFSNDAASQTKRFQGSFWATGDQPPKTVNWVGAMQHSSSTTVPWWAWVLGGGGSATVALLLLLAGFWKWRACQQAANETAEDASEAELCIKKNQ